MMGSDKYTPVGKMDNYHIIFSLKRIDSQKTKMNLCNWCLELHTINEVTFSCHTVEKSIGRHLSSAVIES